jgi:hypothetical protein
VKSIAKESSQIGPARRGPTDPEQAMLAAWVSAATLVFEGRNDEGVSLIARTQELLETEPSPRDDPRHLSRALLCASSMRPDVGVPKPAIIRSLPGLAARPGWPAGWPDQRVRRR